jgi:hypothetical protein
MRHPKTLLVPGQLLFCEKVHGHHPVSRRLRLSGTIVLPQASDSQRCTESRSRINWQPARFPRISSFAYIEMKKFLKVFVIGLLGWASHGFAATFSTGASADAFVAFGPSGNLANNNYGGGNALAIAAGGLTNGEFQSVIKFDLSGALTTFNAQYGPGNWSIQSVSLQLTSSGHSNPIYNDIVAGQFGVSLMQNNGWLEGTGNASNPANNGITFNSLQSVFINNATDQALGIFNFPGGSAGANGYSLNLSSGLLTDILNGSNLSLRLFAADSQVSYLFGARTATPASSGPQLIITAVPEPQALTLVLSAFALMIARKRLA